MRTRLVVPLAFLALACQSESSDRPVSWDEISGKPSAFPTTWADVAEKPGTYPTTWPAVAGAPATFPSSWEETVGKPLTFPTTWTEVGDRPASFPSTWDEVSGKPDTFPAAFGELSGIPSSFPTDWSDVANRPASFPSEWSAIANRPAVFPADPALVQARVAGACEGGAAIAAVNEDGSVSCAAAPARPVTVQLPAATWGTFGCASASAVSGLAGVAVPGLLFAPLGACGTSRTATTAMSIPLELPAGARGFRVRAIVGTLDFPAEVGLWLDWRVPTAGSGAGSHACYGLRTLTVPALPSVQAMTAVEFDFHPDPELCGQAGDPLVLLLKRTDGAGNRVLVHALNVVFE